MVLATPKSQLASNLATGVTTLSGSQQITFNLYRKYVYPLDGMVYWIAVDPATATAAEMLSAGRASEIRAGGEAVQIVNGNLVAGSILGGKIVNPARAEDQGLATAERLFVDKTGPAYSSEKLTTFALEPGESFDFPANPVGGVWANAASSGHRFAVIVRNELPPPPPDSPVVVQQLGSLHYSSQIEQREDAVVDTNSVVFTSLNEIQAFNQVGPDYLYVANYNDMDFAFASRGHLYEQSDLYHYVGQSLYSTNRTQLVKDPTTFAPALVVSNSLPIWLSMPGYVSPYAGMECPLPLYPSYLVSDNLSTPFGSVHISDPVALQSQPMLLRNSSRRQLTQERVRIAFYGADNDLISDFFDFIVRYAMDWTREFGFFGPLAPTIRDEKKPQPELKILSQAKCIEFDISYNQQVARNIAQQFILGAKVQSAYGWL